MIGVPRAAIDHAIAAETERDRQQARARYERATRSPGEVRLPDGRTLCHVARHWPDRQPPALPIIRWA